MRCAYLATGHWQLATRFSFVLLLIAFATSAAAQPTPLVHAHAHNDYLHARPLGDALGAGFCSIEADVFLVDGKLLVAHDALSLDPRRTLQSLYLYPLMARVKANGGRVFADGPTVTLLVDLKTDGPKTYEALAKILPDYADMLTRVEGGKQVQGAVTIVISGNRPVERIAADEPRYAAIDGRLTDLDSEQPTHLMPMISDNWTKHFTWQGDGPMPDDERRKLHEIVQRAHARERVVRFWRTPESPAVWRELRAAGVDLVNTDRLAELKAFLLADVNSAKPVARERTADRAAVQATPVEAIQAPPGFKVERLYSVPAATQGSWVSLAFDPRGRLIVCDQYGGLFRVTPPPLGSSEQPKIEPLDVPIGGAHGLLYAEGSLYVTNNEQRGGASGLYRLRDTDGDDRFDEVKLLRRIEGSGEHGPHGIVLGPDGKLYLVAGNFTKIPNPESSLVPRLWQEDQLLPRMPDAGGHDPHVMAPAGWIARTDLEAKAWELVAVGFRNAYDLAFNRDGELFTYDSDMEWDIGAPWYRPTRVCQAIGGAEFGFRNGSGKWPPYYPDSLPAVVDIGPGSPTGMLFGYGARFPAKFQEALFLLDWSYGIIYAAHLSPQGAGYTATVERFVSGAPLPVTDAAIGPDGAMYFTTGGRKTQSGLYRVSYVGDEPTAPAKIPPNPEAVAARQLRRQLESLQGRATSEAVDTAWPHLAHADRPIRFAARTAIEHHPVSQWQARALAETNPRAALAALLALVRAGEPSLQGQVLGALAKLEWERLDANERLELLRVYALTFTRMGRAPRQLADALAQRLDAYFPASSFPLNRELSTLLVYLDSPTVVAKALALSAKAPTQQEQTHYALVLRRARAGWTPELRAAYFRWFHERAAGFRGGHSFAGFLRNVKNEAAEALSPAERAALGKLLDDPPLARGPAVPPRKHVKNYTLDELLPLVAEGLRGRSFERGRATFAAASCFACHRFADEAGIGGPDLTSLAGRFSVRDLLESIVEPDKVISDQYQATTFQLKDGRIVTGRIVNAGGDGIHILPNMLAPDDTVKVRHSAIEETAPSKVSPMPAGLLNTLEPDEILDLMAYLLSRGDPGHAAFK